MTQCGFEVWNLLARCCAWVQHTDKRIARIHVDQSGHNVHHHVKKRGERERERKSINLLAWAHTTALPSSSSSVSSTLKWSELREGASSNNASVTGACRKNSSNNHRGAPDGKHASQSGATSATQFEDTQKKNQKTTNQFVCNLQPTSKTLSLQWWVSQSTAINQTQLHWKSSVPPTTYLPKTLNCDNLIPQCASKSALMEQKRQQTHKLLKGLAPHFVQHW